MTVPATAKAKTIKPRQWEGASVPERVVYLDDVSNNDGWRFEVYTTDGQHVGHIEGHETSITTKIAGTRLVRHGRRRVLWFPSGQSWNDHESQADAIRTLLAQRGE